MTYASDSHIMQDGSFRSNQSIDFDRDGGGYVHVDFMMYPEASGEFTCISPMSSCADDVRRCRQHRQHDAAPTMPPSPSSPVQRRRSSCDRYHIELSRRKSAIVGIHLPHYDDGDDAEDGSGSSSSSTRFRRHSDVPKRLSGHLTFSTQVSALPRAGASRPVQGDCIPRRVSRRPSI